VKFKLSEKILLLAVFFGAFVVVGFLITFIPTIGLGLVLILNTENILLNKELFKIGFGMILIFFPIALIISGIAGITSIGEASK